jgi:hypothetical protein
MVMKPLTSADTAATLTKGISDLQSFKIPLTFCLTVFDRQHMIVTLSWFVRVVPLAPGIFSSFGNPVVISIKCSELSSSIGPGPG